MSTALSCAKCGSAKVVPSAAIVDSGDNSFGYLRAEVQKDPDAFLLKKRVHTQLRARICCECGHTELVADNLYELWEAWKIAATKIRDEE